MEYASSLIKYILNRTGRPYKITFIFDDIEAKDSVFHMPAIEVARHMFSRFNATDDGNCTVKVLFYDGSSESIPNIIQHGDVESQLICLYIMKYLLVQGCDDVYGEKYVEGSELYLEVVSLLTNGSTPIPVRRRLERIVREAISFLYARGILFRSLYDIETEHRGQIHRVYCDSFKLYLSPRGVRLYKLLGGASVVLELYRDDVMTDLCNNDVVTSGLGVGDTFLYLLDLIGKLFVVEKRNLARVLPDLQSYVERVGNRFLCEHLLRGVVRGIALYYESYEDNNKEYDRISLSANAIISEMKEYARAMNGKYGNWLSLRGLDDLGQALSTTRDEG
ncbi:MAG: hypothetical protein Q4A01_12665 [Coriobacteriales bacterium]|nr:hypothetical protein [Coriobacteriales bacterium]